MGKKWTPTETEKPDYSSIPRRESFAAGWAAQEKPLPSREDVPA